MSANVGGCPAIYKENYFKKNNIKPISKLINTELLAKTTISFQVDQTITKKNLLEMSNQIIKVFKLVTI